MPLPRFLPALLLAALLPSAVAGASPHAHAPAAPHDFDTPTKARGHAHEHGRAQLNVVREGPSLQLQLVAPADVITGFEHMPRSGAQERRLTAALSQLRQDNLLLANTEALCRPQGSDIDNPFARDGKRDSQGFEHRDFTVRWQLECRGTLREINATQLFRQFPRLRVLTVNFALPDGQGSLNLVPAKPRGELRTR